MKWHSLLFISLLFGVWGMVAQHGHALSCVEPSADWIVQMLEDDDYPIAFVGRVTRLSFLSSFPKLGNLIKNGNHVEFEVKAVFKGDVTEQYLIQRTDDELFGEYGDGLVVGQSYFVLPYLGESLGLCNHVYNMERFDVPLSTFGESYAPLPGESKRGVSRNVIALLGLGGAAGAWFVSRRTGNNDNKWEKLK